MMINRSTGSFVLLGPHSVFPLLYLLGPNGVFPFLYLVLQYIHSLQSDIRIREIADLARLF